MGSATWIMASAVEYSWKGCIVSLYRKRQSNITKYYSVDGDLVYFNNIQELMEELQIERAPEQWRLFIDLWKSSLKAVLCHNRNTSSSIPPVHAVHVKKMYENLQVLLQKNVLWRTWVEYVCWPKSSDNAEWAARQIHKILLLYVWLGLPSNRLPLQNKKKNGHSIQKQHEVRRMWHILL